MSFRLDRDDRVVIGKYGCFGGITLVDLTLDQVPDDVFAQVKRDLESLGSGEKLETDDVVCSNGFTVLLGNRDTPDRSLSPIFNGQFKRTPKAIPAVVVALQPYMPKR